MAIFTRPCPSKATSAVWKTRAHTLAPFLVGQALFAWSVLLVAVALVAVSAPYQTEWPATFPEIVAIAGLSVLDVWLCMRRKLSPLWSLIEAMLAVVALAFSIIVDGQWLSWYDPARRRTSNVLLVKMAASAVLAAV